MYRPGSTKSRRSCIFSNSKSRLYLLPSHMYCGSANSDGSSLRRVMLPRSLMKSVTGAVPVNVPFAKPDLSHILYVSFLLMDVSLICPMSERLSLFSTTRLSTLISPKMSPFLVLRKSADVLKLMSDLPLVSMFMAFRSAWPTMA